MNIKTTRFGEVEVNNDYVLDFVMPILGFDDKKKFMLIEHDSKSCFKWLQSIEDGSLAFPVTSTTFFGIDYNFEILDDDAKAINLTKVEDMLVLNIATIPSSNPKNATMNLRAPIVANLTNMKAMQIVLKNDSFDFKYPIFNKIAPAQPKKEG